MSDDFRVKILCKYKCITTKKDFLPLFICFKENNHVEYTFDSSISEDAIKQVLKVSDNWFEDLKVVRKYIEVLDKE